jgi:hypothetical protein
MLYAFVEHAELKQYEVIFTLDGKRYSQIIGARNTTDARELIRDQHPKAKIVSVREKK